MDWVEEDLDVTLQWINDAFQRSRPKFEKYLKEECIICSNCNKYHTKAEIHEENGKLLCEICLELQEEVKK